MIDWKLWFHCAGIRALKTAAQVAILAIAYQAGPGIVEGGFDVFAMDWAFVLSFVLGGAILSLMFSLKGLPEIELEEKITAMNGADRDV
jgi:hypothetical protein